MKQLLQAILPAAIVSAIVSFVVVTMLWPQHLPNRAQPVLESTPRDETAPADLSEDLDRLEQTVAFLEAELELLKQDRGSRDREPIASAHETEAGALRTSSLGGLDSQGEELLRAEVTKVVAQIEEKREAEEREQELEERREEAVRANAEYDELDLDLDQRVAKLGDRLNLGIADRNAMRDLLALQNDRNREMTRLWSAGETSDEELGAIYESNRSAHRTEVLELLGSGRIDDYRKFLTDGGLGGRFSYFTTPWEEWDKDE